MKKHFYEEPQAPLELQLFHSLNARKALSPEEKKTYNNLQKGYDGELQFFEFLNKNLPSNRLILNSLRLPSDNTEFQLDSLLIWQTNIYLFEVKNFEGDFYIQGKNWYVATTGKEINNPLIQLARSESLLRQLINQLGYNYKVKSHLVFINPEFTLFQAPMNLPFIFSSQLKRFIKTFERTPFVETETHRRLANQLIERHIDKSSYERLPKYSYDELEKGIRCMNCPGFLTPITQTKLCCQICGEEDSLDMAVIRSVKEFNFLFPKRKITTSAIHKWISATVPRKTVWRILSKYMLLKSRGKNSHYIFKSKGS